MIVASDARAASALTYGSGLNAVIQQKTDKNSSLILWIMALQG